jgi:hypothetical protein
VQPAAVAQPVAPAAPVQAPPKPRVAVWLKIGLVVAACVALIALALGLR